MKISPKNIVELKEKEIFVFGSNSKGQHLGGAARLACEKFGAIYGRPIGFQGKCYAIDTMSGFVELSAHVKNFIEMAKINKQLNFLVTEIGCGIAGYAVGEIAPLFKDALELDNIYLPERFVKILNLN